LSLWAASAPSSVHANNSKKRLYASAYVAAAYLLVPRLPYCISSSSLISVGKKVALRQKRNDVLLKRVGAAGIKLLRSLTVNGVDA
jgi:hypothetical protein